MRANHPLQCPALALGEGGHQRAVPPPAQACAEAAHLPKAGTQSGGPPRQPEAQSTCTCPRRAHVQEAHRGSQVHRARSLEGPHRCTGHRAPPEAGPTLCGCPVLTFERRARCRWVQVTLWAPGADAGCTGCTQAPVRMLCPKRPAPVHAHTRTGRRALPATGSSRAASRARAGLPELRDPRSNRCTMLGALPLRHLREAPSAPLVAAFNQAPEPLGESARLAAARCWPAAQVRGL